MIKRLPRRLPFKEEHHLLREVAREFFQKEVEPFIPQWEKEGMVPREIWEKAGSLGLLCPSFPEEYGGAGGDFLHHVVINEELSKIKGSGFFLPLHSDIVAFYILKYAKEEKKKEWLPDIIAGKKILAVAMTEPEAGSDLARIKTRAEDKGDYFLLNGQKTFISNGYLADLVVVAARTGGEGIGGISLLVVESTQKGFKRGKKLEKIGLKAQDTAELFFEDVEVPKENLLGKKNQGFRYLMQELQQERLSLAISNITAAETILEWTIQYTQERTLFGKKLSSFQNTRFQLAKVLAEQEAVRALVDNVVLEHIQGKKILHTASIAKYLASETLKKHVDICLQFFGGYGYIREYPIARAYEDARVQTIYAGTSEVMLEIIASKGLGI